MTDQTTAPSTSTSTSTSTTANVLAVVALARPIQTGRGVVSEITIRPPRLRDLKAAGGSFVLRYGGRSEDGAFFVRNEVDHFKLGALLAQVSGLDEIALDDLAASDVAKIAAALAPALEA
jgi:hypothetical protein